MKLTTAKTFAKDRRVVSRLSTKPLPRNREEFENRAQLFQFLQSFKRFIEIKAEFAERDHLRKRKNYDCLAI